MSPDMIRDLAILTLRSPAAAASQLLTFTFPARFLWLALILMAVLNAVFYALAIVLQPPPDQTLFVLSPFSFLVIILSLLVGVVWAMYLVGRWMGGTGSVDEMLMLITWMQFLQILAEAAIVFISLLSSALSMIASIAVFVIGLWVNLHFLKEGHRLESLGEAACVLIGAVLVAVMGGAFILSLVAAPLIGAMGDV